MKKNKEVSTASANKPKINMQTVSDKIQAMIDKGNSLQEVIVAITAFGVATKTIIDLFNKFSKKWLGYKMLINIGVKDKNDEIFDIIENLIVVKKENGNYEIMRIYIDDENMYRVGSKSIKLVYGKSKKDEVNTETLFLKKSDKIFKISYNNISIKKKNGDIAIYSIKEEENGIMLGEDSLNITNGNKIVTVSNEDASIEIITF